MRFVMALAAVAAFWVQPASAAITLTFEEATGSHNNSPIIRDGFEIGAYPFWVPGSDGQLVLQAYFVEAAAGTQPSYLPTNGTGTLYTPPGIDDGNPIYIRAVDGSAFTLDSFDISAGDDSSQGFRLTGYADIPASYPFWFQPGSVGFVGGPLGAGNREFKTYQGLTAPIRLAVFTPFSGAIPAGFQLDNIVLTPSLPEPSTWAMMLLGFGFVGAAMRRRHLPRQIGGGTVPGLGAGASA